MADAIYLLIWACINLLLHKGFGYFHPSKLVFVFYLTSQVIFALSTLSVIVLHGAKDITTGADGGFSEALTKFRDMGSQVLDLAIHSTFLFGWAIVNWALDLGLEFLEDASIITFLLHWSIQIVFAVLVLYKIVREMYNDIATINRRLFPKART